MTNSHIAISAVNAGVKYDLRLSRRRTLRQSVLELLSGHLRGSSDRHEFWALRDVTFALERGEVLGVVGRNGSGKSTLLMAIAGVLRPDAGAVTTWGRAPTLLTLGAGFESNLSGRDNIYLNAAYLGFRPRGIDERMADIIGFSELGRFIDAPVATYSTGMRARLAFSIAAHTEPEILLLDEVLGVGDAAFQQKSRDKMAELMERAHAMVVVSHNERFIREVATKALWLDGGRPAGFGDVSEVIERYGAANKDAGGPVRAVA